MQTPSHGAHFHPLVMPTRHVNLFPLSKQELELQDLQRADQQLAPIIDHLENGVLPKDNKIALTSSQYIIQDSVLHRVEADSTLRTISPANLR